MKNFFISLLLGFCLLPKPLLAKLEVFACEPEWASLAKEIGGELVHTFSATNATQDPHYIRARPSLIAKVIRADLLFCTGADLEIGWLPILLERAKSQVQEGAPGHLMAADYVPLLEKPKRIDRSMGDVHPDGNPHIHLNPYHVLRVGEEYQKRLKGLDPKNAKVYERRYKAFAHAWRKAIRSWERKAKALRGTAYITHHNAWIYLFDWLSLELAATLEARPGIAPSTAHLQTLLHTARKKKIAAIIRSPYASSSASKWLSAKTKLPHLVVPYTVDEGNSPNLFRLYDNIIAKLLEYRHAR